MTRPRIFRPGRPAVAGLLLGVGALVLAACGSSGSATPTTSGAGSSTGSSTTASSSATTSSASSASTAAGATAAGGAPTVQVASTSRGRVLVDSGGMALYTYGPDHGAALSTCTGACIEAWPPLTVPAGTTPRSGAGVSGTVGVAKQRDGAEQVTYDGDLLYTFLSDPGPDQVTGNGVAGFADVAPGAPTRPAATTTTPRSSGY
ncbi:MAG TPA: hypothetical protein VMB72_12130 [Acidimicrobiales bacterium]|nr:hypothetical protein [Acidimicrobiales bacterium]